MQSPPGLHMITLLLVSFCWKLKLHNTYKCWCSNLHVFPSRPGHLASTPKRVLSMPTSAFNTRNIMYSAYYGRTLALQGLISSDTSSGVASAMLLRTLSAQASPTHAPLGLPVSRQ